MTSHGGRHCKELCSEAIRKAARRLDCFPLRLRLAVAMTAIKAPGRTNQRMSAPRPALCPPGGMFLNRMGRRLQKGGEALHDDVIALARRRLQAGTVENLHFPPAILD
jgi:hypothetical protein